MELILKAKHLQDALLFSMNSLYERNTKIDAITVKDQYEKIAALSDFPKRVKLKIEVEVLRR